MVTTRSDHTEKYERASEPFVGRWNHLVSTTNWEKGRIIAEWRAELKAKKAPSRDHSDEAWARRVGGVSPQHVGRLRRVHERFGDVHSDYDGLFWSHFQASLEFDDAEMWLEGAVQNGWSVSQMRHARWEALGAPEDLKPRDEDIIVAELDEDALVGEDASPGAAAGTLGAALAEVPLAEVRDPDDDAAEGGSSDASTSGRSETAPHDTPDSAGGAERRTAPSEPAARPFAELPPLPDDVAEAVEALKVAIVRHKMDEWKELAAEDLLAALDALRMLVTAPSGD